MNPLLLVLLSLLLLMPSALMAAPSKPDTRMRMDMNGRWEFRMDPKDEGVAQGWIEKAVAFPDKIQVPGNWQSQGFGEPRNHLNHDYQGQAWYRKSVRIPANWTGKRVYIHLDGVSALGDVYVNGKLMGTVEHFVTPYEFEITDAVVIGGSNTVVCRVDSRSGSHDPHRDPITRPGPVGMFNYFGHWGGLYRPVWLEARSNEYISTVHVTPDIKRSVATSKVAVKRSSADKAWTGTVKLTVTPVKGGASFHAEGVIRFAPGQSEAEATVAVKLEGMRLWSPENPQLYTVTASCFEGGNWVDTKSSRFGMRELTVGKGGTLLLNGHPYFIRGLGDDCVEAITGTLDAGKDHYKKRIKLCKSYGFNAFRFLAHTPPSEVFDAADELGFLIWAEAPAYWNHWERQNEVVPLYKKMVPQIIEEHFNHPSWYVWSAGNECGSNPVWMDYVNYAHDTFKKLDPSRFFLASSGIGLANPSDLVTWHESFEPSAANDAFRQPFHGAVSELACFTRALSASDMVKLAKPESGYSSVVMSCKPSGYWRLNDKAPGKVTDFSGYSQHGMLDASAPAARLGLAGVVSASESGSIWFGEGVAPVNLKSALKSAFAKGNEPFSLSMFVKPDRFAKEDYGSPFAYGSASAGKAFLMSIDGEEGTGKLLLGRWMANFGKSTRSLTLNSWNHIGISYDGAKLMLYINGQLDASFDVNLDIELADARIGGAVTVNLDSSVDKPHIWHEFPGSYAGSLPDITILPHFTGVIRDGNCVSVHVKEIEDYGLMQRYPDIRRNSDKFLKQYLEYVFEAQRKSPTIDGFNYWLHTDLPGGVEGDPPALGILNVFYEPEKYPDPAPLQRINGDTVLLMSEPVDRRVIAEGETRRVSISVSHFGERPITNGKLDWTLKAGSRLIQSGEFGGLNVELGQPSGLGTVEIAPGQIKQAQHLILKAVLSSGSSKSENEWDFWAFPAKHANPEAGRVVNLTGVKEIGDRYAAGISLNPGITSVVVTNKMSSELADYANTGGSVIVLTETGALMRTLPITYWIDSLRSGVSLVEKHPAMKRFPSDTFCSYQFYRLFGAGVQSLDLTTKGSIERNTFLPIVWGMKADFDPESPAPWPDPRNRTKLYRCGLVSEARVGKGRIIVCSLWVMDGILRGYPEAGYLLDCLVDYATTDIREMALPPMTTADVMQVFK